MQTLADHRRVSNALIVGIAIPALGVAAGIGVVLYFLGALVAHLPVGRHDLVGPMVPGIEAAMVLTASPAVPPARDR